MLDISNLTLLIIWVLHREELLFQSNLAANKAAQSPTLRITYINALSNQPFCFYK